MSDQVPESKPRPVEAAEVVELVTAGEKEKEEELIVGEDERKEEKKRRRLLVLLLLLVALLVCVAALACRYFQRPAALPDLVPLVQVNLPPHYLFSVYGADKPVGVAISPQEDRIYAAETGGQRLIKMFDRNGTPQGSFFAPGTTAGQRSPVYLATDSLRRVYVTDRIQHAVFVFDGLGTYQDTILGPDLTLSEYVSKHVGGLQAGAKFSFTFAAQEVHYQKPGGQEMAFPAPDIAAWSPLGIRIEADGTMLLTDVVKDQDAVREIPGSLVLAASWQDFNPPLTKFGASGQGNGQFLFPNSAVVDSKGRVYVTDGNNGRVSVWDSAGAFLFNFGKGSGDGALNLPRGAAIDDRDRLYVVDAVGQNVKVYDVSGTEPSFLFAFGELGMGNGQFNYPNDIALDSTGRLYVADRENDRIQVWSY